MRCVLALAFALAIVAHAYDPRPYAEDAVRRDQVGILARLVEEGASLEERDAENGGTLLHRAAYFGSLSAARYLLYGATPRTPPRLTDTGVALLNARDRHGGTPLHYAAMRDRADMVRFLLQAGADPSVQLTESGVTALYEAARSGARAALEVLCEAAPHLVQARAADGTTPLYVAAARGEEACVEALLEHGAPHSGAQSRIGATPLHAAASAGAYATAAVLLEYGARADATTSLDAGAVTPLHAAVHENKQDVYGLLLNSKHGAEAARVRDRTGKTAREYAASLGYTLLH